MAKSGANKPHYKTKEYQALSTYISKSSQIHDPVFSKLIRDLRPDWFLSQTQIANQKKQELIRMANNGEAKPSQKTKIGQSLVSYTKKSSQIHDPVFSKLIRDLRPDWFLSQKKAINQKKQKLIQIARNDEAKPSQKTKEGITLSRYTNKLRSSYCPNFNKTIRKLRPDWFRKKRTLVK